MEKRKVVYMPFDGFKKSERPYQILKPKEDGWEGYGRKYNIRSLFSLLGNQIILDETNPRIVRSNGTEYIVNEKVLTDLVNYQEERRKRKESLEQKV